MPLGRISKDQIKKAYTVLSDLQNILDTKEIAIGSKSKKGSI